MSKSAILAAGLLLAPLSTPALAQPTTSDTASQVPDRAAVLALIERTTLAQIEALEARPLKLRTDSVRDPTANWVSAAFYTSAARLARISDRPEILRFLRRAADHYNYALPGAWTPRNMINADDQAVGELYQELYARTGQAGMLMPLKQRLDYTLPFLTATPAPKRLVWWWCDALYMAPPVLARMSVLTGDPAYLRAMDVQWWRTYDRLWDPEERLYFRDERFIARRSAAGRKIFWSRGIGWVVGGHVRVLEAMPADFPSRPRYIATLRAMLERLVELQRPDGLWTASLLDPEALPGPETSGSAFILHAMAWGINHGLLDRVKYQPVVLKGWAGLTANIQPNGLLGHVQRTGDQPVPTAAEDTGLYGTGALVLAGLEVMELSRPVTGLPLAEPARDLPPREAFVRAPLPDIATPEQRREYERSALERKATQDLAYDPEVDGAGTHLTPPPAGERAPRASVAVAPYRYDDVLWENDRTAHRIYGRALEAHEPPSTSGIDAWGKIVDWPFMERQLKSGDQHGFHGEGLDFYNVGTTRGAGGLGVWHDNKLWPSRNYRAVKILSNGPDKADFEVEYAPWAVDTARKVWEKRRFTLPLGTNFTRMVSTIGSDEAGPLTVAIGFGKRTNGMGAGSFAIDRKTGVATHWGVPDADKGTMGLALLIDPAMIVEVREDADNFLVLLRVLPGKPFVYYMGAAWSKGREFHSRAEWEAYARAQKPDFRP
jgi:rhamnogalacturonyl hydrolase YesR